MPTARLTYNERPSNVILNINILIFLIVRRRRSVQLLQFALLYHQRPLLVVLMSGLNAARGRTKPVFDH